MEIPGGSQNTEPKDPENSGDQGESGEGTPDPETPPAYLSDFNGAETYSCTDWNDLVEKINALADTEIAVFSVSGRIDASTDISLNKGRKVLLKASGDTTVNISDSDSGTDLISLGNGKLVIYGSDDAKITFTGERSTSIFNVNNSDAELIVAGNVEFENFICTNQYAGGAINAVGGQLYVTGETLENPVIFNNCSANKDGGAIYINVSEHKDGYMQLSDIVFGSENGKENICGADYYSRDIYINSVDEVPVFLTGRFRAADSKVEIFAASYFILGSETETTADLNITFDSDFFDKAISNDKKIICTYEAYEEALLNHIKVRPLSSPDWERIDETGHVITD